MRWGRASTATMAVALLLGGARLAAGKTPRDQLRRVEADAAAVEELDVRLSDRCRDPIHEELRQGRRSGDTCREERELAGRTLVRARDEFGFVERRQVDLAQLRLTLGLARRCHQWPLRQPDRDVLRRTDVAEARCRLRRYEGELPLTFVDRQGRRHQPLPTLRSDRDGRLVVRFADLDRALRALGAGELDDYARVELGDAAWAGTVDLDRLLGFRADWHLNWVTQGRGSPGLFVMRHPEHPGADDARTLWGEAQLARQLRDYERVRSGQLPARTFFDRHPRSPYHRQLRTWLRTRDARPYSPGGPRRGGASGGGGP